MGTMDMYTRLYLQRNAIFADFMNTALFQGQSIVHPEDLHEMNSAMDLVLEEKKDGKLITLSLIRDILKEFVGYTDGERVFAYLGIENQTDIHYAIPVWVRLYDDLQLYSQVQNLQDMLHDIAPIRDRITRGFEGMKIHPVFTVVLYWGDKPWNGPTTLYELFPALSDSLMRLIPDYRVTIIEPRKLLPELVDGMQTDLKLVFQCMRRTRDSDEMRKLITGNERFKTIDKLAVHLIKRLTGANIHINENDTEGQYDMCQAWEEICKEEQQIGRDSMQPQLQLLETENDALRVEAEAAKNEAEAAKNEAEAAKAALKANVAMIAQLKQNLRAEGFSVERIEAMFAAHP